MKDSALVKLCRNLTKNDFRALRKTVRSPYFNLREDVIRLLDYLADNINGDEALLERERVFAFVFPEKKFDMPQLRYAMSFLLERIKEYLSIDELRQDTAASSVLLNDALKRRGCTDMIEKEILEAIVANSKQTLRHADFYLTEFKLRVEDYYINASQHRNTDYDVQPLIDSFSNYQVTQLLKLGCMLLSNQTFTGQQHQALFLNETLALVEDNTFTDVPAVMVWYNIYKCLENSENEANYQYLKEMLPKVPTMFPPFESSEIFLSAINFCIRRLNKGDQVYLHEAFHLYQLGFESQGLLPNGILTKYTYFNAMAIGIRLKDDVWVANFLQTYKQYLPEKERDNAYRYNMSFYYYFLKHDYDQAMTLLQQIVQFGDTFYNLDARRMLIRIYYETKAINALESQLESYKAYLRRHKEVGYHHEMHTNFVTMVSKMIVTDLGRSTLRKNLLAQVQEIKVIADRDWLVKQLG